MYGHCIAVIATAVPFSIYLNTLLMCMCPSVSPSFTQPVCLPDVENYPRQSRLTVRGWWYDTWPKAVKGLWSPLDNRLQAVSFLINIHIQLNNRKSFSLSSLVHRPCVQVSLRRVPEAKRKGEIRGRKAGRKRGTKQECRAKWRPLAPNGSEKCHKEGEGSSAPQRGWSPRKRQVMPQPHSSRQCALTSC